jgi:hypothetical protein
MTNRLNIYLAKQASDDKNNTLGTVAGVGAIGGAGYLGYKALKPGGALAPKSKMKMFGKGVGAAGIGAALYGGYKGMEMMRGVRKAEDATVIAERAAKSKQELKVDIEAAKAEKAKEVIKGSQQINSETSMFNTPVTTHPPAAKPPTG